ncbi:MAG: hypothetical protein KJZ84_18625 [Bryobacteraceae bacterium]|nr:hypothetical protein [Bryobacteraceae bacterium]
MADNEAMQAEQVDKLAASLGIPKLSFDHPARGLLLDCFPKDASTFRNVVLTGTAGDGKTSLCFELVAELTGRAPKANNGIEKVSIDTADGTRTLTLIYDVTGWRKRQDGYLSGENVGLLESMATSAFGEGNDFFVLAVNDGQMHELFRSLPADAPEMVRQLERSLIDLHARNESDCGERLRLINLSRIPSERIMRLCLAAVLDRNEWACFSNEQDNPLFSPPSSLARNYKALTTVEVRERLCVLARIADASGHHLPIRGVLCLLCNALLGHPDARDRVIRPGAEADTLLRKGTSHRAALHRTLFGENLTVTNRRKREVYRFLSMLHIGEETTNDLDELFIFGSRDQELDAAYQDLIAADPFLQRNPDFDGLVTRYIRGDMGDEDETTHFLEELASERRRVFLQASAQQFRKYALWKTSVFHHALEFLDDIVIPIRSGKSPSRSHVRKMASGLNRIWTGMLLADHANEIYLTTGLDLTTSPVSDIYLTQVELDSEAPGLSIVGKEGSSIPVAVLHANGRDFRFDLTLPRFEFLCRVADGAMPSSFSRESCTDFMSLKQRCLRDLHLRASSRSLHLIDVLGNGTIQRLPIHMVEQ